MPWSESDGERLKRIRDRREAVDRLILDRFDPDRDGAYAQLVADEGAEGLLGDQLDRGELMPDRVYALMEQAWDAGVQHGTERTRARHAR
jgi:hypothetical protein